MSGTLVSPQLRHLNARDRGRIEEITRAVGLFREDEIPVALEVFDEAVRPSSSDAPYVAMGADVDGRLAGWICWGPTPCTLGTYDLYWMAVDPSVQGSGIGTALIIEMERSSGRHGPADRGRDRRPARLFRHASVLRGPRLPRHGDDSGVLRRREMTRWCL